MLQKVDSIRPVTPTSPAFTKNYYVVQTFPLVSSAQARA